MRYMRSYPYTSILVILLITWLSACATHQTDQDKSLALATLTDSGISLIAEEGMLASLFNGWTASITVESEDLASEYRVTEAVEYTPLLESFDIQRIGELIYLVARGSIPGVAECYSVARPLRVVQGDYAGPLDATGPFASSPTHQCTSMNGCEGCDFVESGGSITGCECVIGQDRPNAWCQHQISSGGDNGGLPYEPGG